MNKSKLRILTINLVIVAAIAGAGYWGYSSLHPTAAPVALQTVTVARGDVSTTVSSSGTVISPGDIALAPTTPGTLVALYVKPGASVHAGEVLASVDTSTLKTALAQAKQNLVTAQTALKTSTLQFNNYQLAVTTAQKNLTYQQTLITASQASDNQAITTAQNNLTYQQAAIKVSEATDTQAGVTAQNKLNLDKTTASQNVSVYQSSVDAAKLNLASAQLTYNNYEGLYGSAGITLAFCSSINTINSNCTTLETYNNAVINAQAAYNNSLTTQSQNLVKDVQTITVDQQSYDAAIATAQLNIKKDAQTIATDQQTISDATATANLNVTKNGQALITANQAITAAQYALKMYQAQNGISSTGSSYAVAAAQISNAQAAYLLAKKNFNGATIVAPVAGKVASISNVVGGQVGTATTPTSGATSATGFIVLTNVGGLQVTAGFSESDVAKIAVGQNATIAFTALPNASGTAHVSNVALLPTTSNGATTYSVTFQLAGKITGLKPGMTATATVIVADSPNAISVTSRAVTTRGTNTTVNVVTTVNGKKVETPTSVIVGIVGDSADEILSGLQVGQVVALPSIVSTTSSLTGVPTTLGGAGLGGATGGRGGGGGGGGGGNGG